LKGKVIAVLLPLTILLLLSLTALAQTQTTGRIAGTVEDQNGALITGAQVTIISKATGDERRVTTDTEGNYAVPLLLPGSYRIRVEANGFDPKIFDDVQVNITETTLMNATARMRSQSQESISILLKYESRP
jgi:protocatechuate 3,4-dioxygenase beta subunit